MKPLTSQDEQPKASRKMATVALFGAFGPPILTAARSLRDAGIDPVVLGVGSSAPLVWSSAIRFASYMRLEDVGTPAGIAIISDFIQRTNAEGLLAFWDPEMLWLAANQDSLPRGCRLLMSSKEALQGVQSKQDQLQVAERCGFSVLPTWQLSRQEDVSGIDPAAYPVCLRPSAPSGVKPTFKVEVLRTPSELNAFLGRRTWGREPLLVQPFLPLPTVVIHGVRSESGELLALEAFIAPMKSQGITLELRPLRMDENVALCCRKFANEVGITGPFHFELLYSTETGSFYYLEINVRLGGTTDKVFRLGFDEPLLTLSAYGFEAPLRRYRAPGDRPVTNRKSVLKHMVSVARGRLSPVDYPVASPFRHLLLSLRALLWDKDSIAYRRDLRGTWLYYNGGPKPAQVQRRLTPRWVLRLLDLH
jgi:hypothetical protein